MEHDALAMLLDFRDIEYVSMIAQEQSISRAAAKLHITQPALSIYLKNLETRLGIPLFNRLGKQMLPTYAGSCVVERGRGLLLGRGGLSQQLQDIKNHENGLIRLGITPTRGIYFLPMMLHSFRQKFPQIEVQCTEADAQQLETMLLAGTLDVAFINLVSHNDKLTYQQIIQDAVVLFVSQQLYEKLSKEQRPGFAHPWVDLRQLASEPFIRNYPEQHTEQIAQQAFRDYGIAPPAAIRISNHLTALNLAAYGYGAYLSLEYLAYNLMLHVKPAVLSIGETPGEYGMQFVAATAKGAYQGTALKSFIDMARQMYTYEFLPAFPPL